MNKLKSLIKRNRKVSHGLVPIFLWFAMLAGIAAINITAVQAGPIVHAAEGDDWRYFKGTIKPPYKWTQVDFDDSNWLKGLTGFGYGNSRSRTYLDDMKGNYSTVYARRQFTINNMYAVSRINLSILCDGAFIAYLNSVEIIRNDAINKSASTQTPPAEQLDISGFIHELFPGKNVLSVECNNDDISSEDFLFIPVFEVLEHKGGQIQ
jgi:hypothetical protein